MILIDDYVYIYIFSLEEGSRKNYLFLKNWLVIKILLTAIIFLIELLKIGREQEESLKHAIRL